MYRGAPRSHPRLKALGFRDRSVNTVEQRRRTKSVLTHYKAGIPYLLDRMGSTELAANYFRATQAEDKLRREEVHGDRPAQQTHHDVGKEVRDTIERIGGTVPEDLPAEAPIKQIRSKANQLRKLSGAKTEDET